MLYSVLTASLVLLSSAGVSSGFDSVLFSASGFAFACSFSGSAFLADSFFSSVFAFGFSLGSAFFLALGLDLALGAGLFAIAGVHRRRKSF